MKKAAVWSIKIVAFLVIVFLMAQLWWYLWMYHGWVGSPKILHQFVHVDGESSFDRTLDEMFIISAFLVLAVYVALLKGTSFLRKSRKIDRNSQENA